MLRTRWRWLVVVATAAAVVGVSVLAELRPVSAGGGLTADGLRERVLASAAQPYRGYAETVGRLGLPPLPQLDSVAALLSGTTRLRAWYASPTLWRVDELTLAGEHGTYRNVAGEFLWDYEADQLTTVVGAAPVRPPRPADLLPPELARRLLGLAGDDPVARLPSRRIAGIAAAGLRLTPRDPATTIGSIDVWADPATGLPLRVELTGRGADGPVLVSRLLEVSLDRPAAHVFVPSAGPSSGRVEVPASELADLLSSVGDRPAPRRLADRDRRLPGVDSRSDVAVYGPGLGGFALVPLTGRVAARLSDAARDAGGVEVDVPGGATAVRLQSSVLTLTVVRVGRGRSGYLLAGAVVPEVLDRAAVDLAAEVRR